MTIADKVGDRIYSRAKYMLRLMVLMADHDVDELIELFNNTFSDTNTRLVKGTEEPIYIPANIEYEGAICSYHQVVFAHGFFASALHEIAHWCIAGAKRRNQLDYGYWYCPDGRDEQQQAEFESVEVKPQAIEWCFSVASQFSFKVSTDNLNGAPVDRQAFQEKVLQQVKTYLHMGLPNRAQRWVEALCAQYKTPVLDITHFASKHHAKELCFAHAS